MAEPAIVTNITDTEVKEQQPGQIITHKDPVMMQAAPIIGLPYMMNKNTFLNNINASEREVPYVRIDWSTSQGVGSIIWKMKFDVKEILRLLNRTRYSGGMYQGKAGQPAIRFAHTSTNMHQGVLALCWIPSHRDLIEEPYTSGSAKNTTNTLVRLLQARHLLLHADACSEMNVEPAVLIPYPYFPSAAIDFNTALRTMRVATGSRNIHTSGWLYAVVVSQLRTKSTKLSVTLSGYAKVKEPQGLYTYDAGRQQ